MPSNIDTSTMEFEKLADFVGKDLHVQGFFFSDKGKYGRSVAVVADGHLINFPNWAVTQFEEIASNSEMVAAMFDGHLLITDIHSVDTGKGNPTTAFAFADC